MQKRFKYFFYFFLITAFIQGCGIFDTRDPEPPETVRSTYTLPTTAGIVIDNLESAIAQKNSDNYLKCLSSTNYQYVPDSRSQQNYELIFSTWNQQAEKKYLDNLILVTQINNSVLFLDNRRMTQINSDSALFQANYIVVFQHNLQNIPKSARGNLTLNISTDNELFYIKKWEDFRQNDTDFTWSELKAKFSN